MHKYIFSILLGLMVQQMGWANINVLSSSYTGSGCPQGTAEIVFSPNNKSISILFSGMDVTSDAPVRRPRRGGEGGPTRHTECNLSIDIAIPVGMQLEMTHITYRGAVSLPSSQSYANLNSMPYFVGGTVDHAFGRYKGEHLIGGRSVIMQGPMDDEFVHNISYAGQGRNGGYVTGKHISACRGRADLRIKTQSQTYTHNPDEVAYMWLSSADTTFASEYQVALMPCDAQNRKREKLCSRGTC